MKRSSRPLDITTFDVGTTELIAENNQLKRENGELHAELRTRRSIHKQQMLKLKKRIVELEKQIDELRRHDNAKEIAKSQAIANITLRKNALLKAEIAELKYKLEQAESGNAHSYIQHFTPKSLQQRDW